MRRYGSEGVGRCPDRKAEIAPPGISFRGFRESGDPAAVGCCVAIARGFYRYRGRLARGVSRKIEVAVRVFSGCASRSSIPWWGRSTAYWCAAQAYWVSDRSCRSIDVDAVWGCLIRADPYDAAAIG
ncbi:MAG: hypothetical protein GPJ01_20355 [Microcystis aeruginosa LL13-06]|nr:hypothetical protein [Microcystis aeruginosa LL13-06]NCS22581.1 hypothetical protein [Microcystis aeruginosa G11-06]